MRLATAWARKIAKGGVCCWRCGGEIPPGSKWHLGHDDHDRTVYRGPEHALCNLRAAGLKAARSRRRRLLVTSRVW